MRETHTDNGEKGGFYFFTWGLHLLLILKITGQYTPEYIQNIFPSEYEGIL